MIAGNDRVFVCGTTRSGKSSLLARLALQSLGYQDAWVVDTKRDASLDPIPERYRHREPARGRDWDAYFHALFERGNTRIIIDELAMVADAHHVPGGLQECYAQGAARGIGIWAATQRPVSIPRICYALAEHLILFRVGGTDARILTDEWQVDLMDAVSLPLHHYLSFTRGDEAPVPHRPLYLTVPGRPPRNNKGGDRVDHARQ